MKLPAVLRRFRHDQAAGGIVLMLAAAAALVVANSHLAAAYDRLRHAAAGPLTVEQWVNDALMALFFLLVGLEIKRELIAGALADPAQRRLPVIAAAAGMLVPALVYLIATGLDPALRRGWAIPVATDIAFAVGVLALLGSRVPARLKLFLVTVAIVDDIGAVAIIALGYSAGLDWGALAAAAGTLALLAALNRRGVATLAPYLALAVLLWLLVFRSGVHATIAGVLAASAIPLGRAAGAGGSPLHRLEHVLGPWVAFAVVPLFGFVNAGVALDRHALAAPLTLAIMAGLAIGKPLGILGGIGVARRLGIAAPIASRAQLLGIAPLAGIGFTMSLFLGGLAFPGDPARLAEVKLGVLAGSLVSALAGYCLLRYAGRR